jgi:hypothetical protein
MADVPLPPSFRTISGLSLLKCWKIFEQVSDWQIIEKDSAPWSLFSYLSKLNTWAMVVGLYTKRPLRLSGFDQNWNGWSLPHQAGCVTPCHYQFILNYEYYNNTVGRFVLMGDQPVTKSLPTH